MEEIKAWKTSNGKMFEKEKEANFEENKHQLSVRMHLFFEEKLYGNHCLEKEHLVDVCKIIDDNYVEFLFKVNPVLHEENTELCSVIHHLKKEIGTDHLERIKDMEIEIAALKGTIESFR